MRTILYLLFSLSAFFVSCNKLQVEAPSLSVQPISLTIKAGDTAKFQFSGYADYINFYSGEVGRDYYKRDSFSAPGGNPEFQFLSNVQLGATSIRNLSVHVSTDFNGNYNAQGIAAATWTNITNRVTLSTSATNVSSGIVNLNDLKAEGKPMYVAFRYLSESPETLKQRQWTISSFQFRTKFPEGQVYTHAASNTDAGFGVISVVGDSANWVSGTSLTHVSLNAGLPSDDDWAISRPFDLTRYTGDRAGVVVIKNLALTGLVPAQFSWRYPAAGTYKAVFVYRNANVEHTEEVVKEFVITVNP